MTVLDPCHCRNNVPDIVDRFFCAHPAVAATDSMVAAAVCQVCGFRNSPPPASLRPVPRYLRNPRDVEPCLFLGPAAREELRSSHCLHPSHGLTTQTQCNRCRDYEVGLHNGPGAVHNWAVGVTTAPRPVTTLGRTLQSLANAGWPEVFVFAEPGSTHECDLPGHVWCPRGAKLGAFANWYLSLTELVLREPYADAYFLCQDDVEFCSDLRSYLEGILWLTSSPKVLSPYCAAVHDTHSGSEFHQIDEGSRTCGALSLILPNAVARAILCDSFFIEHRRAGPGKGLAHIDSVIGAWCQATGIGFWVHSPSLCQHTGVHSTLWGDIEPSPRRTAASYCVDVLSVSVHPRELR